MLYKIHVCIPTPLSMHMPRNWPCADSLCIQLLSWCPAASSHPWAGLHFPLLKPRGWVLQARTDIPPLKSNKMKMSVMKGEAARFIRDVVSKLETYSCGEPFNICLEFFSSIQTQDHPHATYLWQAYHSESPRFQFISIFQRNLFGK